QLLDQVLGRRVLDLGLVEQVRELRAAVLAHRRIEDLLLDLRVHAELREDPADELGGTVAVLLLHLLEVLEHLRDLLVIGLQQLERVVLLPGTGARGARAARGARLGIGHFGDTPCDARPPRAAVARPGSNRRTRGIPVRAPLRRRATVQERASCTSITCGSSACSTSRRRTRSCQARRKASRSASLATPCRHRPISVALRGSPATCCRCAATSTAPPSPSIREKRISPHASGRPKNRRSRRPKRPASPGNPQSSVAPVMKPPTAATTPVTPASRGSRISTTISPRRGSASPYRRSSAARVIRNAEATVGHECPAMRTTSS